MSECVCVCVYIYIYIHACSLECIVPIQRDVYTHTHIAILAKLNNMIVIWLRDV